MDRHLGKQVFSLFGKKTLAEQFHVEGQPSFQFLHQEHWFVPCALYQGEIHMVRPHKARFHCFQWAVLSLLDLSYREPSVISDLLCFPDVTFVQTMLADFQAQYLIDAQCHLTEEGRQAMEEERKQVPEVKKVEATFFQNLLTGSLLPYLHLEQGEEDSFQGKLSPCHILTKGKPDTHQPPAPHEEKSPHQPQAPHEEKDPPSPQVVRREGESLPSRFLPLERQKTVQQLSFVCGSIGAKENISGLVISSLKHHRPPSPKEGLTLLQEFKQYTTTSLSQEDWEISSQYMGDSLHLHSKGQGCYFHVQGGKVQGDADTLIISDGFRPSLVELVAYMEQEESQWVERVHQSAIVARRLEEERQIYQNETYPSLLGAWLLPLPSLSGSKDKEKALESAIREGVIALYGELEWALHYYFVKNPISPSLLEPYAQRTLQENRKVLSALLKKAKVQESRKGDESPESRNSKLDLISQFHGKYHLSRGVPTMTLLFPLLLLAWEQDKSSILSQLRKKIPDFYPKLAHLHPIRNKAIHQGQRTLSLQSYSLYQDFASDFLDILLPDWKNTRYIQKEVNENNSDTNRRLSARQALYQEFGFAYVNQYLTEEMVETFFKLSPYHREPATGQQYINGLSLLLELSFAQQLRETPLPPYVTGEQITPWVVAQVEKRNISLPSSLTTVKSQALEKALQGEPSTLGAEVLAYYYQGQCLENKKTLDLIDKIIALRGHGNQGGISSLLLDQKNLEGLKKAVISIMKGLVDHVKKEEKTR